MKSCTIIVRCKNLLICLLNNLIIITLVQTSGESELASAFNSKRSSYESMYVGSRPPSDGRWETWMNYTGRSPYPIRYSLRPLVELLDTVYFPGADDAAMRGKRARFFSVQFS